MSTFRRIGENLNVMSTILGPAMRERNQGPIRDMARRESEKGVDYLDVNIGPARKDGPDLLPWLVRTIQEATDTPLSLDTTNIDAMEAGMRECRRPPLMNSISLQSSRLVKGLELAVRHSTDCIALLWSDQGMPRDANERAMLLVDFMQAAQSAGVPLERIWIDPIVTPISVEVNQVKACVEFMDMVKHIAPGARTVCGLSNVSNGVPADLRPWLNRTYLIMLMRRGLNSAIVDSFDDTIRDIISGGREDIVRIVWRIMDGDRPDMKSLNEEEIKYAKTAQVLTGASLFSNLWLET